MVTHGICHLIGYDHEDEKQWDLMYKKELEILQKFNTEAGLSCKPLLGIGHLSNFAGSYSIKTLVLQSRANLSLDAK